MTNLSKDLLRELFDYENGQLFWKESRGKKIKAGAVAGCKGASEYIQIKINSKAYKAHRIIWIYHNGNIPDGLQIDHINGIRNDNRVKNLRLVTHQENQWNRKKAKGYSWHKPSKKWRAQIKTNGSTKHIGCFDNEEEAHQAYLNAKQDLHTITQH